MTGASVCRLNAEIYIDTGMKHLISDISIYNNKVICCKNKSLKGKEVAGISGIIKKRPDRRAIRANAAGAGRLWLNIYHQAYM